MRVILSLIAILCGASATFAQSGNPSARIDRIQILDAGIMKAVGEPKPIKNKDISTGTIVEGRTKVVEKTSIIPAKLLTTFGVAVKIFGKEDGARAKLRVLWTYPEPGIKNPATGIGKTEDAYDDVRIIGEHAEYFWSLGQEYSLVLGKWTLELWQGDRRLLRQTFTLVK